MTKIQKLGLSGLTFLLTFFVFAVGTAKTAIPDPPRNVEVFLAGNASGAFVRWEIDDNKDIAANYKVFLAEGQVTAADADADKFELVADFPGSDVDLGGSEPGGRSFASYMIDLRLEKPGPYSLYMIAYNSEGESKISNISYFVNDDFNMGHLRISSIPNEIARIGEEYTYQPVTEYENKIVENASYKLDDGPKGMAFTKSGLLRWMPEESANFHVLITSSAEIDGKEMICFQEFMIRVRACSEPTFISGTVNHENGEPADGHIMIVTTDFLDGNQDTVRSDEEGNVRYYSGIVKDGEYRVAVDKGEFLVFFRSNQQSPNMPESRGEWYENADNPEDAKVVPVDCGDNKFVNMTVDDIVEINMVKVSGTVKYEGESTDPDGTVPSAYVEFFPLSKDGGGANYGKMHAFVGRDGYYEIELPDMYDYKAAAYLYNAEDMNSGFVQYYNLKDNFEDADVIVLDSEKDDINFIFEEPEYKIAGGKVSFKDGSPYAGVQVVFAYADNNKQMINVAVTDESGKYEIKLIADKKYIAYAYNRYDGYGKMNSVQYYNQTDNIEDAEIIELIEDISGIDFVFSKPVLHKISGNVTYEDGSPVIGASVEFESIEGNESGSRYFMTGTRTDKEGNYEIELLDDIVGIILVHSFDSDFDKSGKALYYKQTYILDEAEKFIINQDYTDIDFVLADPTGHTGEAHASAIVRVNNLQDESLTDVIVFAFKVGSDRNMDPDMYNGFSAVPNPDGDFIFRELALGEYVFFAFPMNGEYAPGLYKEGEQAVWSWEDATRVKLEADKKIYGPYTIILPLIDEIEGIAVLEGNISSGQVGIMEDAGDLSITGASVYLINASGSASKYIQSNSKGEFRITGIADGIYTLVVDKVGFKKYTQSVEIFNGESLAAEDSQEISLIPESTTSVEDETEFTTSVNLYPNPTIDNVNISYEGVAGQTTVAVINSIGSELFSMTVNAVGGSNEHTISTMDLASGLYYIKIVNGQSFKMIPLTVVR